MRTFIICRTPRCIVYFRPLPYTFASLRCRTSCSIVPYTIDLYLTQLPLYFAEHLAGVLGAGLGPRDEERRDRSAADLHQEPGQRGTPLERGDELSAQADRRVAQTQGVGIRKRKPRGRGGACGRWSEIIIAKARGRIRG
jgi:hypothetical protein